MGWIWTIVGWLANIKLLADAVSGAKVAWSMIRKRKMRRANVGKPGK